MIFVFVNQERSTNIVMENKMKVTTKEFVEARGDCVNCGQPMGAPSDTDLTGYDESTLFYHCEGCELKLEVLFEINEVYVTQEPEDLMTRFEAFVIFLADNLFIPYQLLASNPLSLTREDWQEIFQESNIHSFNDKSI